MTSYRRFAFQLFVALVGVWLGAFVVTVASARLPETASGKVFAIFPPMLGSAEVSTRVINAGGIPLGHVGAPFALSAYSPVDGFVRRLEERGAVLVVRPIGTLRFAGICGAPYR